MYDIEIRPGLKWSPHPAFAKDAQGQYRYHHLKPGELGDKRSPFDFAQLGTREVVAEDFVYALKRHASPRVEAPLAAVFSEHVIGLRDYMALLRREREAARRPAADPGRQAFPGPAPLAWLAPRP